MFMAALFTKAKTWKELKCPLAEKCIRKCYTHTQTLSLKRKEILVCYTWMNLENILLNEVNQLQKDEYYMIPIKDVFEVFVVTENKMEWLATKVWVEGKRRSYCLMGIEF